MGTGVLMALTESQAKVLGILHALERTETAPALAQLTGLGAPTIRTALRTLETRGLVSSGTTVPTFWQITATGRSVIGRPAYLEYRDHPRLTTERR
ncbi:helix-turn-helix domain-containing protein [Nocardia sp. R16R-3T]